MNTYWKLSIEMLHEIETSEEKRDWGKKYFAYAPQADKRGLMRGIERFIKDTYKNGVVIGNYHEIMKSLNLNERQLVLLIVFAGIISVRTVS